MMFGLSLYKNWKTLLKKAWSMRLMAVAGLLTGVEAILPFLTEYVPQSFRGWFAAAAFVVTAAAFMARLVAQKGIDE